MMKQTGDNLQLTLPLKSISSPDACEQKISPSQAFTLKAFELDGVIYARIVPGKKLFNSTMVHSVVNRGDIFALRLEDSVFTIIPGTAKVRHFDVDLDVEKNQ